MSSAKLATLLFIASIPASAQHLSVGVVGGVPLTDGFSDFTTHGIDTITHTFSTSKEYIVGGMFDIRLPLNFGIEADALYRPLDLATIFQVVPNLTTKTDHSFASWEFPILGKYRLPLLPIVKPFIEAGPSFRTRDSSVSWISNKGFTFGGGIEVKILKLKIAPALRYTHWGSDGQALGTIAVGTVTVTTSGSAPPSKQNQAEFLVGLSF